MHFLVSGLWAVALHLSLDHFFTLWRHFYNIWKREGNTCFFHQVSVLNCPLFSFSLTLWGCVYMWISVFCLCICKCALHDVMKKKGSASGAVSHSCHFMYSFCANITSALHFFFYKSTSHTPAKSPLHTSITQFWGTWAGYISQHTRDEPKQSLILLTHLKHGEKRDSGWEVVISYPAFYLKRWEFSLNITWYHDWVWLRHQLHKPQFCHWGLGTWVLVFLQLHRVPRWWGWGDNCMCRGHKDDPGSHSVYCFTSLADDIPKVIVDYTNLHGYGSIQDWTNIDRTDLRAYVSIFLLTRVQHSQNEASRSLWLTGMLNTYNSLCFVLGCYLRNFSSSLPPVGLMTCCLNHGVGGMIRPWPSGRYGICGWSDSHSSSEDICDIWPLPGPWLILTAHAWQICLYMGRRLVLTQRENRGASSEECLHWDSQVIYSKIFEYLKYNIKIFD